MMLEDSHCSGRSQTPSRLSPRTVPAIIGAVANLSCGAIID